MESVILSNYFQLKEVLFGTHNIKALSYYPVL